MKLNQKTDGLYSIKQMAYSMNMHKSSVEYRIGKLVLKPVYKDGETLFYSFEDFQLIKSFSNITIVEVPSVIYIHTTWEIRESKLNFIQ